MSIRMLLHYFLGTAVILEMKANLLNTSMYLIIQMSLYLKQYWRSLLRRTLVQAANIIEFLMVMSFIAL